MFQVRTIVTETAFSIDELEELYVLFKVSDRLHTDLIKQLRIKTNSRGILLIKS